jgi:Holliday junction resolvase-like predicted endonuclease
MINHCIDIESNYTIIKRKSKDKNGELDLLVFDLDSDKFCEFVEKNYNTSYSQYKVTKDSCMKIYNQVFEKGLYPFV